MIKLEYDVNTSGTRVSFVVKDSDNSLDIISEAYRKLYEYGESQSGYWDVPQNAETLGLVHTILKALKESK